MAIFQPQRTNLFLVFFIFVLFSPRIMTSTSSSLTCNGSTSHIAPTSPLLTFLERVQEIALKTLGPKHFDPKLYVDFPLKFSLSVTEKAFDELPRSENGSVSAKEFELFKDKFFEGAGSDLVYHQPVDYVDEPEGFLSNVENVEVRSWALEVHSLWKNLSRRVSDGVLEHPELHTLLPLPEPVMIPGSRFIEIYYWDSYWVIRGLLVSKMYETAKAIVNNLISLVDKYGFVLNGARSYYTNRSQPPLLSAMVYEIYIRTGDTELARKALPALLQEHHFWNSGQHKASIKDSQSDEHTLSRYYAMWDKPRPESSTMDRKFASKLSNPSEKQQFYREVASTAESGWDFSSRWMSNCSDFTTLSTTSILPVDLNVYILRMETDIAFLAKAIGEEGVAVKFSEAAQTRKKAINSVFWNAKMEQWVDYWLPNGTSCEGSHTWQANLQNPSAFASNYIPLWIDLFNSDTSLVESVTNSLQNSGLLHPAGIATSLQSTGQQWDFPNGWAPLQHMIVEGLLRSKSKAAKILAEDIAVRWIKTNYVAYKKTGVMHEKYDVQKCGEFGGGGEYIPQTGFGWTNGVVLTFLEEFGWPKDRKIDC